MKPLRLLSIGHSYAVRQNRRLALELALQGGTRWEVTCAAPAFFHGDMRPIPLEPWDATECDLVPIPAYLTSKIHVFAYSPRLRWLLREAWDVVHAWEEPYIFAGFQLALWTDRRTRLVYFTSQNYNKTYPPPFATFERFSMKRASGWVCSGNTIKGSLEGRPGYNRPHMIAPYGIDTRVFRPDADSRQRALTRLGWQEGEGFTIGFVGRFVEEKGLRLLMSALDAVRTPWRALFLGTGPLAADLEAWGSKYPNRVRLLTAGHDEVPQYYNAMDLLCAPSQTAKHWREQFGRMLVEAMASGVPVAGSNSGEIPYVIADRGLVVDEKDVAAWTRTIDDLAESPKRRAELREAGLAAARNEFDWSVVARKYLDYFGTLLDAPQRA